MSLKKYFLSTEKHEYFLSTEKHEHVLIESELEITYLQHGELWGIRNKVQGNR